MTKALFPNNFKKVGWILFVPGILISLAILVFEFEPKWFEIKVFAIMSESLMGDTIYFSWIEDNILNEVAILLVVIGALFIAMSRERVEDEYVSKIRLDSLIWAVYINYAILILSVLFVYRLSFYWILILNMATLLIFFVFRFRWALFQTSKRLEYEK